ncbi:MAG: nitrate reductase [Cyanobacteria bacterium P01_A01_bin.84]
MSESVKTLCPYCGVGCGLEVFPPAASGRATHRDSQGNPIWKVVGDKSHPSSQGMVCVKGATVTESLNKSRLKYPMMRDSLSDEFKKVSWDEAFDKIVSQIQNIVKHQGADAICMYGSGQFQTEDYYIAQKLIKGCLGTNNFDANSRLCMSSAVAGYTQSFGSDGPPCCYEDLDFTDCAFLVGTNTAECHPIVFNRLRKHHKRNRNVKMIVVDPRRTKTAEAADLHLAINPGTDIDLFNGIAHLLLQWRTIDAIFIDECTQGFSAYTEVIRHYTPEFVARKCNIRIDHLEEAARYWADSERVLSLWSMGINQSSEGTAKVRTLINLHLMSGNIGKPGAGPFSLTGQPNAMGGREAGGLAHILPGYRSVKNPQHRSELEKFWGLNPGQICSTPGRDAWSMITGLEAGDVSLLWIAATNPAVSMPDLVRTKAALLKSPFTIYQDAYYPTETAAYAHLILPAAQWGEKTGTMTNSERTVTLCSKFKEPSGEAKPDWEIFAEVGLRLGFTDKFQYVNSAQVYDEFVQLTRDRLCSVTEMSHEKLAQQGPLQWGSLPIDTEEDKSRGFFSHIFKYKNQTPTSKRLYTDLSFPTPDGRAKFAAYHSRGLAEPPNEEYPFILTSGRLYGHWHTLTRTGRIEKTAKMHPNPFLEIHPRDAAELGINEGDWVEIKSARGQAKFPAKITKAIAPKTVFIPMHWGSLWAKEAEANNLTHPHLCPISLEPELKACAIKIIPTSALPQQTTEFPHQEQLPSDLMSSMSN